MFINNLVTTIN